MEHEQNLQETVLLTHRKKLNNLPILETVFESYIFLFNNFFFALAISSPYLFLLTLEYLNIFAFNPAFISSHFLSYYSYFGQLILPAFSWLMYLSLCTSWIRSIINGVSFKYFCNPFLEWKIIVCLFIQTLGITVKSTVLALFISLGSVFPLFYTLSIFESFFKINPDYYIYCFSILLFIITIFLIFYFFSYQFLYFPAKVIGVNLSPQRSKYLFKNLSFRFFITVSISILPINLALCLIGYYNYKSRFELVFLCKKIADFFSTLIFTYIITRYFLWVTRKDRLETFSTFKKQELWEDF